MFKRIVIEDLTIIMAIVAFAFTASVFIYTSVRALRLTKERREKLANLPLDD